MRYDINKLNLVLVVCIDGINENIQNTNMQEKVSVIM